jgi:transposase
MEAYPLRMRRRMIELYEQGKQTHEIAALLGTCRSGTRRVRQHLRERGTLQAIKPQSGRKCGMTADHERRLRELVAAHPDATREQLRDRLGVAVDVRTIGRWLRRLGFVLKKSRCTPPSNSGRTSKMLASSGTSSGTSGSTGSTRASSCSSTNPAPARV